MRKTALIAAALLVLAGPMTAQDSTARHCLGLPFWVYSVQWHHPDILAELTQLNGPRSRSELDALALQLARSVVDPDEAWVAEQIEKHWEPVIRAAAEKAARGPCHDDADRMVAYALERERADAALHASVMGSATLRMAAHRNSVWLAEGGEVGIPYDGDGAFEAARIMFLGGRGTGGPLMQELNSEKAAAVFREAATQDGPVACHALRQLRRWEREDGDDRYLPHPSYRRLRQESPERCPELDDPGPGG